MTYVINALSNPDVHMVGVHGMGGIGKTTLAREVGRKTGRREEMKVKGKVDLGSSRDQSGSGGSLESVSEDMVEERRVGREGMREQTRREKAMRNPLTPRHLKRVRRGRGWSGWWEGRLILLGWGRERRGTAWAREV